MYYTKDIENNINTVKEFLSNGLGIEKINVEIRDDSYTIEITIFLDAKHVKYYISTDFNEDSFDCSVYKDENDCIVTAVEFKNTANFLETLNLAKDLAVDDYIYSK